MATVDVTYAPAAGRKFVTLTSWAGDAAFSPTPVADGQIEGPDALTMGADGVVTGSDGTYALTYISPSGNIQAASYEIGEAAESATVTATYAPATGRQAVTLTSWAGSAGFATTPTAGSQIEGANALTIGVDGVITGPDGTYAIHHITTAGVIEADSFAIATADTTAPIISALTAAGTDPDTIDVAFSTDEDNGTAYFFASGNTSETAAAIKAGAQGSQTVSATGDQSLTITLATGTYRIHAMHEDTAGNQSNVLSSAEIVLAEVDAGTETGTGTATYSPPGNMTLTTVQEPVDEYLTDGWSSPPETGEQVLTFTAEGAFDPQLNWSGPAEGAFDYYYINNDGNFYERTITTGSLDSLADTTPAAFSFTDVTGQPVSTVTESNIITITGVDAATDVAASITGGEYAVSTDDGATFGAYTSAATNVQLDDQIKVRVTTSANNSTGTSAAFTAGGVTDTFTATTEAEAASVLESTDLESASNVSSSNISQTHVLESQSLNTDSASSNTQISQTHSLSTENVEAIPTLSLPSFGDMIYALNSSDVESGTNVNTPLLFILSQLNARVSESLSETSNPMISQTHSILTNNVEALSLNSIPFFTGEVAPLNMNGIPVKESVVFSASKMPTSLKQGSYYALKFPVLTNGEAVVSVEDAKFSLYRSGAEVLTKSIVDTSLNFASSTFNVDLDDSETEVLAGLYTFEMWFVDMSGNNIHVRSGNINFEPTKVRFI